MRVLFWVSLCKCIAALLLLLLFGLVIPVLTEAGTGCVKLGSTLLAWENKYWLSQNETFALGFFTEEETQTGLFAVGTWYHSLPKESRVVIWTAGDDVKVGYNSTLELSIDGNLVVYQEGVLAWASNTSGYGIVAGCLHENGDFVMTDAEYKTIWNSFMEPSNTLLPGQRLYVDQHLRAPSSENNIASYYTVSIRKETGVLQLKWCDDVVYWESGIDTRVRAWAEPDLSFVFGGTGFVGIVNGKGQRLWGAYSNDFEDSTVPLRYLRLDVDGNLRMYSWMESKQVWVVAWQAVENQCDVFGTCGVYGVCSLNRSGTFCECPFEKGIVAAASYSYNVGSKGKSCRRDIKLGHCNGGSTMLPLQHTLLYGIYPPHDIFNYSNTKNCRENCLRDASCVAATSLNDGTGICRIKRTSFISGYHHPSIPAISFFKVCLAPEAVSNQIAGVTNPIFPHSRNNSLVSPPLSSAAAAASSSSSQRLHDETPHSVCRTCIVGVVLLTLFFFIVLQLGVGYFIVRIRGGLRMIQRAPPLSKYHALVDSHATTPIRMTYQELEKLTNNFCNKLASTVFLGTLPNQKHVVVKQLDVEITEKEFSKVVRVLGSTRHKNLVLLHGFCFESQHKLLVYEYVGNGSLYQWLFDRLDQGKDLYWHRRLDIASGVARAVAYLHFECHECIAYSNLKLENVILDDEFSPKIAEFGLGRFFRSVSAQAANSSSCCLSSSESDAERDVYNFGIMLIQMISAKRYPNAGSSLEEKVWICKWALQEYHTGNWKSIIDTRMLVNLDWYQVERVLRIAFWCIHDQPFSRPSMREVVKVLEGTLPVERPPPLKDKNINITDKSDTNVSFEIETETI